MLIHYCLQYNMFYDMYYFNDISNKWRLIRTLNFGMYEPGYPKLHQPQKFMMKIINTND